MAIASGVAALLIRKVRLSKSRERRDRGVVSRAFVVSAVQTCRQCRRRIDVEDVAMARAISPGTGRPASCLLDIPGA